MGEFTHFSVTWCLSVGCIVFCSSLHFQYTLHKYWWYKHMCICVKVSSSSSCTNFHVTWLTHHKLADFEPKETLVDWLYVSWILCYCIMHYYLTCYLSVLKLNPWTLSSFSSWSSSSLPPGGHNMHYIITMMTTTKQEIYASVSRQDECRHQTRVTCMLLFYLQCHLVVRIDTKCAGSSEMLIQQNKSQMKARITHITEEEFHLEHFWQCITSLKITK